MLNSSQLLTVFIDLLNVGEWLVSYSPWHETTLIEIYQKRVGRENTKISVVL